MALNQINKLVTSWSKRLSWDEYFMSMAILISSRSSCNRLHVGCVLVKDTRVISVGYNGFLPGAPHKSYVVNNHEQATVHSEQNAVSDAAARGVSIKNSTAYVTHYPCINCAKILAAAGVKNIKYLNDYKNNELVSVILNGGGVSIEKINI